MIKTLLLTSFAAIYAGRPEVKKSVFQLSLPQGNVKPLKDCGSCTINVSASTVRSGDWVQVTLSNVAWTLDNDWVGVFAPEDVDASGALLKYPVRYQYATTSCVPATSEQQTLPNVTCVGNACCHTNQYLQTGNAVLGFHLMNLRMDYVFVLISGPPQFPTVTLVSEIVKVLSPNEPTGVHLALTENLNEMQVTWKSGLAAAATALWGLSPSSLNGTAKASYSTYASTSLCGAPAETLGFRDPGHIFSATFTNLLPNTRYHYQLISVDNDTFSSSFMTAPEPGQHVVFNAFGDMGKAMTAWDGGLEFTYDNDDRGELGSFNTSRMVYEEIRDSNVSLVVHIGDLAYAVGFSAEWDEFMMQIQPAASQIPWMTSPGNHEWNCPCFIPAPTPAPTEFSWFRDDDSGGECGVPYEFNFQMPRTLMNEPWYSFVYGDVFIVMMSTEHDFSNSSKQLMWIESQLMNVNRSVTPFVIFTGHRPMYASSPWPAPETEPLQKYVQPLLLKYGVDLAMWGHHHSYQRTCQVTAAGTCQTAAMEPAVTHVVIGLGGYEASDMMAQPPAWLAFSENNEFGFSRIRSNATHLHFVFLRSSDGTILDYVDIAKR